VNQDRAQRLEAKQAMKLIATGIATTTANIVHSSADLIDAKNTVKALLIDRERAQEDHDRLRCRLKETPIGFADAVDNAVGAAEQLLRTLDDNIWAEKARCSAIADAIAAGAQSVEASKGALATLSRYLYRTPRRATRAINLASVIAGSCYPWAPEAWLADISTASNGSGQYVKPWRQFLSALAIVFWTAPRMRTRTLRWNLTCAAARFGRWCLHYDPATGIIIGACHVALIEALRDEVGFYLSFVLATAVALGAVEVVRRIRKTNGQQAERP
jgi:hypothetical protein